MESARLLKVLGFGARFWNIWRAEHPDVPILLAGAADLSGANLVEADLIAANLEGARLDGANLRQADFPGARLTNAHYAGADLEGVLNLPMEAQ